MAFAFCFPRDTNFLCPFLCVCVWWCLSRGCTSLRVPTCVSSRESALVFLFHIYFALPACLSAFLCLFFLCRARVLSCCVSSFYASLCPPPAFNGAAVTDIRRAVRGRLCLFVFRCVSIVPAPRASGPNPSSPLPSFTAPTLLYSSLPTLKLRRRVYFWRTGRPLPACLSVCTRVCIRWSSTR